MLAARVHSRVNSNSHSGLLALDSREGQWQLDVTTAEEGPAHTSVLERRRLRSLLVVGVAHNDCARLPDGTFAETGLGLVLDDPADTLVRWLPV
jgi:hypothetical protein